MTGIKGFAFLLNTRAMYINLVQPILELLPYQYYKLELCDNELPVDTSVEMWGLQGGKSIQYIC